MNTENLIILSFKVIILYTLERLFYEPNLFIFKLSILYYKACVSLFLTIFLGSYLFSYFFYYHSLFSLSHTHNFYLSILIYCGSLLFDSNNQIFSFLNVPNISISPNHQIKNIATHKI